MEKRAIGVILTMLGVLGLLFGAYNFVNHSSGEHNIKLIGTCCVIGLIFFFAGIGLIRSTRDIARNDEHVS